MQLPKKLIHGVVSKPACAWSTTHMKALGKMGTGGWSRPLVLDSLLPSLPLTQPTPLPCPLLCPFPTAGAGSPEAAFLSHRRPGSSLRWKSLGVETWKAGDQQQYPLPLQEHWAPRLLQPGWHKVSPLPSLWAAPNFSSASCQPRLSSLRLWALKLQWQLPWSLEGQLLQTSQSF